MTFGLAGFASRESPKNNREKMSRFVNIRENRQQYIDYIDFLQEEQLVYLSFLSGTFNLSKDSYRH